MVKDKFCDKNQRSRHLWRNDFKLVCVFNHFEITNGFYQNVAMVNGPIVKLLAEWSVSYSRSSLGLFVQSIVNYTCNQVCLYFSWQMWGSWIFYSKKVFLITFENVWKMSFSWAQHCLVPLPCSLNSVLIIRDFWVLPPNIFQHQSWRNNIISNVAIIISHNHIVNFLNCRNNTETQTGMTACSWYAAEQMADRWPLFVNSRPIKTF